MGVYLTPDGAEALKTYRYVGADHSLLYKYVLSPWAEFCVSAFVPRSMAPNTITTLGFAGQVAAFLVLWSFCPTLTEVPPGWTAALAGVALFTYQTMDNMDGKQARRTGSSSPLGLLCDHGLDCINSGFFGPIIMTMAIGPSVVGGALLGFYICALPFFFNTWEEYHINAFHLPLLNGPNEGLAVLITGYVATALYGREFWATPVTHPALLALAGATRPAFAFARAMAGAPLAQAWADSAAPPAHVDLMLVPTLAGAVGTVLYNLGNVARHHLASGGGLAAVGRAYAQLLPFAALLAAGGAWVRTPATAAVVEAHPFSFYLALGCALADLTSKLMVAHVCKQAYRPRVAGVALLVAAPALAAAHALVPGLGLPSAAAAAEPLLWLAVVVCVTSLLHFALLAPREIADALDIDIFDISKQVARAQAAKKL